MVKCSPTLGTLVSSETKCIKPIFTGKITLVSVAFLMALRKFIGNLYIQPIKTVPKGIYNHFCSFDIYILEMWYFSEIQTAKARASLRMRSLARAFTARTHKVGT